MSCPTGGFTPPRPVLDTDETQVMPVDTPEADGKLKAKTACDKGDKEDGPPQLELDVSEDSQASSIMSPVSFLRVSLSYAVFGCLSI